MRRIRYLLRYHYGEGCSQRLTARYVQMSPKTVRNYLARARAAGLTWPLPDGLGGRREEVGPEEHDAVNVESDKVSE